MFQENVKINTKFYITSKISKMINKKSIQNLTGKTGETFMSKRQMIETENTVKNYLYACQFNNEKNEKKANAENTALTPIAPKTHTQNPTHGATCVSATVFRNCKNEAPKRPNTEGSKIAPFFLTLTANTDGRSKDEERLLVAAFRKFLKISTAENQLRYIWKKEKGIEEKLHFHVIGDCSDSRLLIGVWTAYCHEFGINAISSNSSILQISLTDEAISFTAQYFAKQTHHAIEGKIVSMSNLFQHFKPIKGEKARNLLKTSYKGVLEGNEIARKIDEETGEIYYQVFGEIDLKAHFATFL